MLEVCTICSGVCVDPMLDLSMPIGFDLYGSAVKKTVRTAGGVLTRRGNILRVAI